MKENYCKRIKHLEMCVRWYLYVWDDYQPDEDTCAHLVDFFFCFIAEILLDETSFKGFPVVHDMDSMRLFGYVRRKDLKVALSKFAKCDFAFTIGFGFCLKTCLKLIL